MSIWDGVLEEPEDQAIKPDPIPIEDLLLPQEWLSLVSKRGHTLPPCCANVSALRDQIQIIVREGYLDPWTAKFYIRSYKAVADGHDLDGSEFDAIKTILRHAERLAGFTLSDLRDHRNSSAMEGGMTSSGSRESQ